MREGAFELIRRIQARGHQALLAGGCVRDMLLGLDPQDYDVATDADPLEVIGIFPDAQEVGAHFGVVLVRLFGHTYEVARFRRDLGYTDGRHPDGVAYADDREDAQRRDFTVNGMFYDPAADRYIDYVAGREDLEKGIIRSIGGAETRFREDRLRMLRAIRLAARYNWPIEERTFSAIVRNCAGIREVSAERVRDELVMVLTEGGAPQGVRWLIDSGLMAHLMPEVVRMDGVPQPRAYHPEGDVLTHTLIMLGMMRSPSTELSMGVLLHDVGKPATYQVSDRIRFHNHPRAGADAARGICRRLRFSSEQVQHIVRLVDDHHRFMHVHRMRDSTLKRLLRTDRFEEHLELHRLDCLASHGDLANHAFCADALDRLRPEDIRPRPLVSGHDLIELGFGPGPAFKVVLTTVEDAQLEGRVADREAAIALARETFAGLGVSPRG